MLTSGKAETAGIRARAYLLGLLLIPPDALWISYSESYRGGPYPTTASLFANAVFLLCLLIGLNALARTVFPRQALRQSEILITYTMVCIGASLAGLDMVQVLVQMMTYPFQYANSSNNWGELFVHRLPAWLMVSDPEAVRAYFEGHSSIYQGGIIRFWIKPALWWLGFMMVALWVMMCINVLVRRQWIENERLTFPIIQLPVAMTEPGGALWKNRLFWAGFVIAAGIDVINGVSYMYPSVPRITVTPIDILPNLPNKPWNAVGWTPYAFYPMVIGLGFLLPTDLSFSCWFFYIFWKLQLVFTSAMAWDTTPEFPFIKEQTYGAYMAVVAAVLWSGRRHFRNVLLTAAGKKCEIDDSHEAVSYRTAILGILIGTLLMSALFIRMGLSPILSVTGMLLYLALSVAITRIRAELGAPIHDMHFCGPDVVLTKALGTQNIPAQSLVVLTFFRWFNRAYRGHPMPTGLEGMKMAQISRSSQRSFLFAVMIAGLFGGVAAFWAHLHITYCYGMCAKMNVHGWHAWEAYVQLERWLRSPQPPNHASNGAMLIGFISAALLAMLRVRFINWPFHPIGYAISGSWSMNLVWLPILIAWLAKVSALKFGGLRSYKQVLPFFLGLIVGEAIVGSLWSLFGALMDVPTYSFWGK